MNAMDNNMVPCVHSTSVAGLTECTLQNEQLNGLFQVYSHVIF